MKNCQNSFILWLFSATAAADQGCGGLERKEGSVVVPTELVPLSLEVCSGDGGGVKSRGVTTAKKVRESSTRAKGYSEMRTICLKNDKSNFAREACVFDMLKTNFLSSPSACVKLVDHIHHAGDLGTLSSLSLEKQKKEAAKLLQKGVVL
ncbi:hypothetical protein L3X38_043166 [Prunus dulcis]|uniref:Secreted protein n=1 Tax=Prunus dulcis TaxID=3755 RepID=A0AAD4YLZ7_PRUDU|nr:hypothetical protein L3X38_043166 [Prunus dulcis]